MKIKTIISSICLMLLAVACSMEDDVLRDMEIGDSGNVEIEMGEAAFVLKTSLSSLETKSLSDAGTLPASMDEAEINNCTLIFFEGTQVSSIMEGLFVNKENYIVKTKDGTKDDWAKVILKVKKPSPYSVMVIANSSKSFAGCQSENNIKDIKRIVSFRDKVDGWEQCLAFTYVNKDNNIVRLRGEVSFFLRAFRVNYALRNCCYNCSYCKMERAADFTIGDFWGGDLSDEDKKNGVSLIICHNKKAQNILFNISTIEYKKIDWNECLPNNPRIYCGRRFIQWIIPRKILKIIWKCNYKVQEQVLTDSLGVISKKRFYWIGLKIWRIVILKIEQIYRKAKLLSILKSM